ncbi:MAG: methyltransferase domain-containing protein [Hyphomicrobiaceae bacterium]
MEQTQAYDEKLVTLLEVLWGPGYLSPGGDEETDRVLAGIDLAGRHVLDIGSGTGGCAFHIARRHGPARVIGIDVEAGVVAEAVRRAEEAGLADRVDFRAVAPGPLPFAESSLDVAFSKDSIVHIEDKHGIAAEIFRVLKPGGVFAASDWMAGADGPMSEAMLRYNELEGLGFRLASPDRYFAALRAAGFVEIAYTDRTAWYRDLTHKELAALRGPLHGELVRRVGQDFLDHEIEVWEALAKVLDTGELGPGHFRARKPG